jgi:hypothetical protein
MEDARVKLKAFPGCRIFEGFEDVTDQPPAPPRKVVIPKLPETPAEVAALPVLDLDKFQENNNGRIAKAFASTPVELGAAAVAQVKKRGRPKKVKPVAEAPDVPDLPE